jgi:DNA polymerase III subunit epsilon
MDFCSIDIETANKDKGSICQIGLIKFKNGKIVDSFESIINPQEDFEVFNSGIHGITKDMVKNSPKFPEIYQKIKSFIGNNLLVAHNMVFDRAGIEEAILKYSLIQFRNNWDCSMLMARKTWPELPGGYGLENLCNLLEVTFNHHQALEDARAAGFIYIHSLRKTKIGPVELQKIGKKTKPKFTLFKSKKVAQEGNPKGPLAGQEIVFTGDLSCSREQAAKRASELGLKVTDGVTKKTTILVVGNQDPRLLKGNKKSSKEKKAEELIKEGQDLEIIGEKTFEFVLDKKKLRNK